MVEQSQLAPWWRPDIYARKKPKLVVRKKLFQTIRTYFEAQDFIEVETPCLQISPGNEAHLHAFNTEFFEIPHLQKQTYYLHTSPEFTMKKLLVAGEERIFQFARTFRNGERSSRHHPEFTMLEWYRVGADAYEEIIQDTQKIVRAAAAAAKIEVFSANGMRCNPAAEWEKISVPEAFARYAGVDLLKSLDNPLQPERALLVEAAKNLGLHANTEDSWDDLFFRIMGAKIEPNLGHDRPTLLCDYPLSMAALARPSRTDPRLAERFELYIAGYEIANAFNELTDVDEQYRRFEADMDLKEKLYGERYPIDADFIAALQHGLPTAAGIALGFDRLAMLCAGTEEITDVLFAPVATPFLASTK